MNPQLFLNRLQALRAPKEENAKKFVPVEDDPSLSKKERLARVFRVLYNVVVEAKGVWYLNIFLSPAKRKTLQSK